MRAVAKLALGGVGLGLVALVMGAALVSLPFSTAWLVRAPDEDASRAPRDDFAVGAARWSVEAYRTSPKLEAFRTSFESSCRDELEQQDVIAGALCISNRMAGEFDHGDPESEFFAPSFDPEAALERHSSGAPGHCVSRVAILAAELLSVGVPARVVQLLPLDGSPGHNLVEVWEEGQGWVVVDPTFGGLVGEEGRFRSALELASSEKARFQRMGSAPVPYDAFTVSEMETLYDGFLPATVVYPEPWLYLRVGEKSAPWPFRGRYVQVGPSAFALGPAQRTLGVALLIALPLTVAVWLGVALLLIKKLHASFSRGTTRVAAQPEHL